MKAADRWPELPSVTGAASAIETTASSLRMTPIPWASARVVLWGWERFTKNVSFGSLAPSGRIGTSMRAEVAPAGMVRVPAVAT